MESYILRENGDEISIDENPRKEKYTMRQCPHYFQEGQKYTTEIRTKFTGRKSYLEIEVKGLGKIYNPSFDKTASFQNVYLKCKQINL